MPVRPLHRFLTALMLGSLAACSDGGPSVSAPPAEAPATMLLVARPPSTVRSLVVAVSGPGIDPTVTLNIPVADSGLAQGTISVSAGGGRRIIVTALDTSGIPSHRADTTVRLIAGANPTLSLTLAPLGASAPIVVVFGSISLSITSPPPTLIVGDTTTFSASVTRTTGGPVPNDSVQWASSDPGVLSLVAARATAVRAGSVTVTASFGGVAVTRVVTVGPAPLATVWAWRAAAVAPANTRGIYAAHDAGRREVLIVTTDNRIVVYRIADNTWSELAVSGMPSPAGEYQIAYDDVADRILLEWRGLGSVYAIPRSGGAAVALGNNANGNQFFDHVFGINPVTSQPFVVAGYGGFAYSNTLWRFTSGNQWSAQSPAAPLPWPRQAPAGAIAQSQRALYLFGGEGNASGSQGDAYARLHSLWKFDFATSTWTSLVADNLTVPSSAPAGRSAALAVTPTGSAVFLYGPEIPPTGVAFQSLFRLRPGTDGAFALMPTTGVAPATTQTGAMFYDGLSQDMVLVLRDTPLQVFRVRVAS